MQREGSAFQGLGVVTFKELSDHLTGVRMIVLEWLVILMALGVVYTGIQQIREVSAEDPFLFLRLFTRAGEGLPSFVSVLSFLVPLVAIGIGFDLINTERNQRTLSRILAQPIYRDALLFGKFLAGLATISISLVALWLLLIGLFTRPVAFLLAGEMAIGYFLVHAPQRFFPAVNGGDAAILFCFVFLYLSAAGPGAWSVDEMRAAKAAR